MQEAALEKRLAGENRAVEHVALADDDTDALLQIKQRQQQQQVAQRQGHKRQAVSRG